MKRDRKLLAGVAVSLLLHAALLYSLHDQSRREATPDARRMTVWLMQKPLQRQAPPPVVSSIVPPALVKRAQRSEAPASSVTPTRPVASSETLAASPPAEAETTAPKHADIPQDPFAQPSAPVKGKFDVNAAMKSARKLATAKSTKDDPPVAQIYDKPLYGLPSDTPLGTAVGRTARADCKTAAAGTGILALIIVPVMILTDKKDSGCKW